MHPYLIVELHRARYDEFLRQATDSARSGRRGVRRKRVIRHRAR